MKVLKASVVLVLIFLLGLGSSVLYAKENQEGFSPTDKDLFSKVKVIRVVVEQPYEGSLPFYEFTERILKYAGFQAVKEDAKTYDAILHIKAIGNPGGESIYIPGPGGGFGYSSATLEGEISVSVSDKTFKWNFLGSESPFGCKLYGISDAAPFENAFYDGFPIVLLKLLAEIKDMSLLVSVLKDENPSVRYKAVKILGELKDPRAVEPLISVLKDKDWSVRWEAVEALGKLKDPRAVEPLIFVLKDGDNGLSIHLRAVESLGELKDPRAVEPLISALKNENWFVRKVTVEALGKITGQNFGEDQTKWQSWWQENKGRFLK